MKPHSPQQFERADECVEAILERVGRRLVVGLPIGIGKPIPLVNELYRRAQQDPSIDLTFLSGLSLSAPRASSELERRFLDPFVARVFADFPELDYIEALRSNTLPANVRVIEFFLSPGSALTWPHSQMNYLATNYTQVTRDILARGVNVILQLVATRQVEGERQFSLASNPDVTAELIPALRALAAAGQPIAIVAEVHPRLPFMLGDAAVDGAQFDLLLEHPRYDYGLYGPPNLPIAQTDHAIGLWCSGLLKDGGTLQIGIGELGDAVCYSALLRHQQNAAWRSALSALATQPTRDLITRTGGDQPFTTGLFACSEMFIDQMMDLYRGGVLRRRVYPCLPLERGLAGGTIGERFGDDVLERLLEAGLPTQLDAISFGALQQCGVFRAAARWRDGMIVSPSGQSIEADLSQPRTRKLLAADCLGQRLQGGVLLQAAFLLGPQGFYAALRDLPEVERALFEMCAVGRVNALGEKDRELHRVQRRHGRFINTTMMMTLLGAAVSDTLEDGRVVSGVGGQLNFIMQAMDLPDARSILCLRATREKHGTLQSNIRFAYASQTVPRQFRDIVVTEYGCADLRGRTDAEVVAALLAVTDSRFQPALLAEAKRHDKIARDYCMPDAQRNNYPQRLADGFRAPKMAGLFSAFPFGTDFTAEEIELSAALQYLSQATATRMGRLRTMASSLLRRDDSTHVASLDRMGLSHPATTREWMYRQLLRQAFYSMPRS